MSTVHRDPAVGVPLDGDLAWAIHVWNGSQQGTLTTEQIESLTQHLTEAGYVKPVTSGELSLSDLRRLMYKAQTSMTEFLKGSRAEPHPAS